MGRREHTWRGCVDSMLRSNQPQFLPQLRTCRNEGLEGGCVHVYACVRTSEPHYYCAAPLYLSDINCLGICSCDMNSKASYARAYCSGLAHASKRIPA